MFLTFCWEAISFPFTSNRRVRIFEASEPQTNVRLAGNIVAVRDSMEKDLRHLIPGHAQKLGLLLFSACRISRLNLILLSYGIQLTNWLKVSDNRQRSLFAD